MRYDYSLTVTAGKAESSPQTSVVRLCRGIITRVEVLFPAGSAGLVNVAIMRYGHRLYPTNNDGSFVGDDTQHIVEGSFSLLQVPYEVKLIGWAPNATLSHTVYFAFVVSEPEPETQPAIAKAPLPEGIEE